MIRTTILKLISLSTLLLLHWPFLSYCQTTIIDLDAKKILYNNSKNTIIAILSENDEEYGSSVIMMDPQSFEVKNQLSLEVDPFALAMTRSEDFIFVALTDLPKILKISVDPLEIVEEIYLLNVRRGGAGYAVDMEPISDSESKLVVTLGDSPSRTNYAGTAMYIGQEQQENTQQSTVSQVKSLPGTELIYGFNSRDTGFDNYLGSASDTGLVNIERLADFVNNHVTVKSHENVVFAGTGEVFDPFANTPKVLGKIYINEDQVDDGFMYVDDYRTFVYSNILSGGIQNRLIRLNFYDRSQLHWVDSVDIDISVGLDYRVKRIDDLIYVNQNKYALIVSDDDRTEPKRSIVVKETSPPELDAALPTVRLTPFFGYSDTTYVATLADSIYTTLPEDIEISEISSDGEITFSFPSTDQLTRARLFLVSGEFSSELELVNNTAIIQRLDEEWVLALDVIRSGNQEFYLSRTFKF